VSDLVTKIDCAKRKKKKIEGTDQSEKGTRKPRTKGDFIEIKEPYKE